MDQTNVIARHSDDVGEIEVTTPRNHVVVGAETELAVQFRGKERKRDVNEIALTIDVPYRTQNGFQRESVARFPLVADSTVEFALSETRTAAVTIPWETPETVGGVDVLATVEIATERETATYETHLDVTAPRMQTVFRCLIDLGFVPRDFDCVADHAGGAPFVQRFVFQPTDGPFRGDFDDVELRCRSGEDGVSLLAVVGTDDCESPESRRTADGETTIADDDEDVVRDHLESFFRQVADA